MPESTITVTGNLTRDPEKKYTQAGAAKTVLGVACNRRWLDRATQEWQEKVSFFNVVSWSDLAEHVDQTLSKGDRVIVTGRLEQRTWETDDNEKRSVVEIVADDIGPSCRYATADVHRVARKPATGATDTQPASAVIDTHFPDAEEEVF